MTYPLQAGSSGTLWGPKSLTLEDLFVPKDEQKAIMVSWGGHWPRSRKLGFRIQHSHCLSFCDPGNWWEPVSLGVGRQAGSPASGKKGRCPVPLPHSCLRILDDGKLQFPLLQQLLPVCLHGNQAKRLICQGPGSGAYLGAGFSTCLSRSQGTATPWSLWQHPLLLHHCVGAASTGPGCKTPHVLSKPHPLGKKEDKEPPTQWPCSHWWFVFQSSLCLSLAALGCWVGSVRADGLGDRSHARRCPVFPLSISSGCLLLSTVGPWLWPVRFQQGWNIQNADDHVGLGKGSEPYRFLLWTQYTTPNGIAFSWGH
jgi:hypothetical protein